MITIKPSKRNTNKHTTDGMQLLENSINKVGVIESISVATDGTIISGHARKEIFDKQGKVPKEIKLAENEYPVILTAIENNTKQYFEAQILANTTANKNFDLDIEEIEVIAEEYDIDIEEIGIDVEEIDEVLEAKEDDFDTTPLEKPITVLGDLYEIGNHRLLCGDSTDSDQVAKLMQGEKADISFTSPPYNAGKTPTEVKMGKKSKYASDDDNKTSDDYLDLLRGFTSNALMNSIYSFVNVQSIAGNKTCLIEYLHGFRDVYADTIIWQKQTAQPAMAKNVLNSQYEYVHCFSEKANRAIGVKQFRGTLSNVIQIQKQTSNDVKSHNATFPVAFAAYFVENFSIQSVLDLFLGSGTTMVASHQLKRKCYGMELDPKYCDVIVKRMLKLDNTLKVKINGIDCTNEFKQ
jgi:DNA modification methylase